MREKYEKKVQIEYLITTSTQLYHSLYILTLLYHKR